MRTSKLFLFGVILISAISFVSCDNDNDYPDDPVGTVSLNMMNEDNGKTELGNSDIYIDKAGNFHSPTCTLSSIGKKNGLGSVSGILLQGGTNKAAVEVGNAYQIFNSVAIRKFPSGKLALHVDADYYNAYVVSQIKKNNTVTGANVKFVRMDVPDQGLPKYNSFIGTLYPLSGGREITVELPTSDFECEHNFNNLYSKIAHEKDGNKLVVKLIKYEGFSHEFGFYIRIKDSYTYVYGDLK